MHETLERPGKQAATPKAPVIRSVDDRITAKPSAQRRSAQAAKWTAINEAKQGQAGDIGSPLVAPDGTLRMVPNLGRTVHVVGTVHNVDTNNMPHPKNIRGELGKAMHNWYCNTVAKDPLMRATDSSHAADKRNFLTFHTNAAGKGKVNQERVTVDPVAMSRHIKKVAKWLGADIVGIARVNPNFMYASGAKAGGRYIENGEAEDNYANWTPDDLAKRFPFVIQATVAWDYDTLQAHRHHVGDLSYHHSSMRSAMMMKTLEGYIKDLGYTVLRGTVNPQGAGLAAGLGELGRNGMMISEKYGARIHMPDPIMTDMPLVPDKPIDIGVEDFCKICRKCAANCPTNSISFGPKVIYNGIEKYKINWLTCYKIRPYVADHYGSCLTCIAVCPFTKPNVWWRRLGGKMLSTTPIPARPPVVRALKWIDDKYWGEFPKRRVKFMGYDTGVTVGSHACTIPSCTAEHKKDGREVVPSDVTVGKYAPIKKQTNEFVKRG
jgi:reductive dehalogenase